MEASSLDILEIGVENQEEWAAPISVEEELENFRSQWQKDISQKRLVAASQSDGSQAPEGSEEREEPSVEEQARYLFLQGVNAEQSGKMYDAIKYYRKAVQLVPDIEFRIDEFKPKRRGDRTESESSVDEQTDNDEFEDLLQHFMNMRAKDDSSICQMKMETKNGHASQLPWELLMYIFQWVVSSDLDLISLESLSEVCRGFYICARDESLWKMICQRTWGRNCGKPKSYGTYRNMYLQKPHLRFNGVYISRHEYYRCGEKSLDSFYKPYHMVEYFRYVKFFPDGHILMLTSPHSPYIELPKLKNKNVQMPGIMHGYYKLSGDTITAVLKRVYRAENVQSIYRYRNRRNNQIIMETEQTFHVEFLLRNAGRRSNAQLLWNHYSVRTCYKHTGEEIENDFDLNNKTYPPLIFSRVKNYTNTSTSPLGLL